MPEKEIIACKDLVVALTDNTESDINIFFFFCNLVKLDSSSEECLKFVVEMDLALNLQKSLRILLTLPVTLPVASGESTFSKLHFFKTSTMSQERLTRLAMIAMVHEIVKHLETNKRTADFAQVKCRRHVSDHDNIIMALRYSRHHLLPVGRLYIYHSITVLFMALLYTMKMKCGKCTKWQECSSIFDLWINAKNRIFQKLNIYSRPGWVYISSSKRARKFSSIWRAVKKMA